METLSILSGVVLGAANLIYIVSTIRGNTKPTRGSWVTWAVLDAVLLWSMYTKHVVNGQVIAGLASSAAVATLSLFPRWGKPGWTKIEKICLAAMPLGLALWWLEHDASWGIGIFLLLIAIGCLPTYESAWIDPGRESRWAWTLSFFSSVIMTCALTDWSFASAAQPVVWLLTQIPMMYFVWLHKK